MNDPDKPVADESAAAPDSAREPPGQPKLQSVLVASIIGAIILMIAIGAFWTTF